MTAIEHQQLAILALEQLKGDDTARARAAWRGCTSRQMNEPYGQSGLTRQQILNGHLAHDAACDAAIAWVKSKA